MPKTKITKLARRDIVNHILYLHAEAGIEVAAKFDKAVNYTLGRLLQYQGMGTPVDSERPRLQGVRKWRVDDFERFLIFYLPRSYGIVVVHVKHSSQNWWKQLKVRGR